MTREVEIAVVGAGPAGLAAATAAAEEGARVALIDDQDHPGGQFFRAPAPPIRVAGSPVFSSMPDTARRLSATLEHPRVDYLPSTTAWNVPEPGVLAITGDGAAARLHAGAIVIAAGAHDRVVPFPGWTLPGVVTAGGAQNLMKGHRMIPGRKVVLAGNGPLLLAVGSTLARAGAEIIAVAEAAPIEQRWWRLPGLFAAPDLALLGARYRWDLMRAGAKWLSGHTVVEARGDRSVESVTVAPIAVDGSVDHSRATTIEADTLVAGFGLRSSAELTRLAGCAHRLDASEGGWTPIRSPWLETTVPGLFAAGDGAGVAGAYAALAEGTLAGLAAVRHVRRAISAPGESTATRTRARLARLATFRAALDALYRPPRSWNALLRPDTIICRCEDVTLDEIQAQRRTGMRTFAQIKGATRAGMGRCQGRNCLESIAALIGNQDGPSDSTAWPRLRPPARPIPIGDLLEEPLPPPDIPEDGHLPRSRRQST